MYDEDKVADSLEFVKDIKVYLDQDEKSEQYVALNDYAEKDVVRVVDVSGERAYQNLDSVKKDVEAERDDGFFLREVIKDLAYVSVCVIVSFVFAYLLTHFVAHHNIVEGNSMQPTLHNEDHLIVEKVSYYFRNPERYDIVIFPVNGEVNYIKRIIGLPGERIRIQDGEVYVNGAKLDDPFGGEPMAEAGIAEDEVALGDDEYFVLGDNRNASVDSRKAIVGLVARKRVLGRAWIRFYPFDRITILEHKGT